MSTILQQMPGQNQSGRMSSQEVRKLADFRAMAEAHIERLGRAIQARRKEVGWSRARLGREVSAHEKTVERWEKAQTGGALENLEQIAAALDMDADALLAAAMPRRKGATPDLMASHGQLDRIEAGVTEILHRMDLLEAERAADELARPETPASPRSEKAAPEAKGR